MKKLKKIKIIDRESKHDGLKERIFPHLSSNMMNDLRGGCDPWSDCDAWNCYPDCVCKDSLC